MGLVLISAAAIFRLLIDPGLAKENWRATAAYVHPGDKAGEALVMQDFQIGIPSGTYYRGVLAAQPATISQQTTPLDELSAGYDRMWLVYRRPLESTHRLAGWEPFTWHDQHEPMIHDWPAQHDSAPVQEETFPGTYVLLCHLSLAGCPTDDQD